MVTFSFFACSRVDPAHRATAAATEMAATGTEAAAAGHRVEAGAGVGALEAAATEAGVAAISWDLVETLGPGEDQAGREGRVVRAGPVVQEDPEVQAAAAAAEKM